MISDEIFRIDVTEVGDSLFAIVVTSHLMTISWGISRLIIATSSNLKMQMSQRAADVPQKLPFSHRNDG
ncbi:MAG: hypothetical protein HOC78_02690 [Candidatus Komeilibacteria bacterium]|nr:hypothetical protein [Candidatus Komeilibacteria bacterium]